MRCNFHFSGKWKIRMSDFGAVWGGTGVCKPTCLYGPLLITSRSVHKPNFMQKCPGAFLGEIVKLWILHKNDFLCNTQSLSIFPQGMSLDIFA